MTLIAGLRDPDGYVIFSDSQETVGQYRLSVQKVTPRVCGRFEMAIAGSGANGDLIDAFVERLQENVTAAQSLSSLADLKSLIHTELLDFRRNEAADYARGDKDMSFIIGARMIDPPACIAWKTSASRLTEITTFDLTGFEDERYHYIAKNLYRSDLTTAQAIFLGLHLMSVAEQTSNYVKAPVTVVIVRNGEMRSEKQSTIDELLQRVRLFEGQFDGLFLACPDTGLGPENFAEKLKEFVRTVAHLRQEYLETSLHEHMETGFQINDIYNLIPAGMSVTLRATQPEAEAIKQTQVDTVKALRENYSHVQEYDRVLSNLAAMEKYHSGQISHLHSAGAAPMEEMRRAALLASGENLQAALMGPYKISDKAVLLLNRVREFELIDLGFGEVVKLQLLVMAIKQAAEFIQKESHNLTK